MQASHDSSFYLYGVGESPEALTLGSLVLEKYWQPLIARHYTHKKLRCSSILFLFSRTSFQSKKFRQ